MRRLGLRKGTVRLLFHGMDQIGEFDRVLDEEDRDIVADNVPIALLRVEFDREAAHVACQIHRPLVAGYGREADKDLGLLPHLGQHVGLGMIGQAIGQFEYAVGAIAAGVDHALGNALMIEMEDLLAQDKVFEQRGASFAGTQAVLIVGDRHALLRGHRAGGVVGALMGFAAMPLGFGIAALCRAAVVLAAVLGHDGASLSMERAASTPGSLICPPTKCLMLINAVDGALA